MTSVRPLALVGGWLLDAAVGDPRRGHPVAAFGALASGVERRCWVEERGPGAVYATALVGAPAALAWAADRRLAAHPGRRAALLLATLGCSLGGRSLGREGRALADAVAVGDLAVARRRLPALCGRDATHLDGDELCRAAVESVAENTADAVVAPLFWAAAAGPPGVVAHRCANTLDAMVGHRDARYRRFGWASARLDDALGYVPARMTVALAAALAPTVGGRPGATWDTARRDGRRHPSPNAGPCEAAFAGALGVRLGGSNRYAGERVEVRGPHGDGPAPGPGDVRRAVALSRLVGFAAAVWAALVLAVLAGRRRPGDGSPR